METCEQLRILAQIGDIPSLTEKIRNANMFPLCAKGIDILQINSGKRCNLSCRHCHVDAGHQRTEIMSRQVLEKCLDILSSFPISTIDITGGAPEMNPYLEWFIREAARLNRPI
jgi:MoaA/NifB/PqqE/SkfB family radical SAM enzyme